MTIELATTESTPMHYWIILNNTTPEVTSAFLYFRNQPTGTRFLYPVWQGLDGRSEFRPTVLPDSMIGETLGEIRAMGFPNAYPFRIR